MSNAIENDRMRQPNTTLNSIRVIDSPKHVREHEAYVSLSYDQFEALLTRMGGIAPQTSPPSGLGNPGPLGLAAFALTTFMLSVFNAGSNLIDSRLEEVVLPVALFYGGIAQFAAGMWEFRTNNTFGATAFTSYGAFWMSFAGYVYFIVPKISDTNLTGKATGLFLFCWLLFTLYMTIASWRVSKAVFAVFATLSLTFLLLTIGSLADASRVTNAGGWFGIFTAFFAWYGSAAVVINTTYGRTVLPIGVHQPKQ